MNDLTGAGSARARFILLTRRALGRRGGDDRRRRAPGRAVAGRGTSRRAGRRRRRARRRPTSPSLDEFLRKRPRSLRRQWRRRRQVSRPAQAARSTCGRIASVWSRRGWSFTTMHRIAPAGARRSHRFGRYGRTLGPGIGITLPAPIETVQKIDVENIRTIDLGSSDQREPGADRRPEHRRPRLFGALEHPRSASTICSSSPKPDETIQEVAESAMRAVISGVTLERSDRRRPRR